MGFCRIVGILVQGLIYLMADNPEGGWIAAGQRAAPRRSGFWLRKRPPAPEGSYSSPVVAQVCGIAPRLLPPGADATITAYRPESGEIAWTYEGIPS